MQKLIAGIAILLSFTIIAGIADALHKPVLLKVSYEDLTPRAKKQVDCLADNIYFEAGYEPYKGRVAVAQVTMNRLKSGQFPNTVCEVVRQKTYETCQFTWWCDPNLRTKAVRQLYSPREHTIYQQAHDIALKVYLNHEKMEDVSNGALYYHATYVNPGWKNMKRTAQIGLHIFYNKVKYQ